MAFSIFGAQATQAYIAIPDYLDIANPRSFKHVSAEGALGGYDPAQALALARLPLQNILKPRGQFDVVLLHGHPGAGKTTQGFARLRAQDPKGNKYVVSSYDEHGALFAIPEYQAEIATAKTFEERSAVWAKYRPLSQLIRSATLDMAIEAGANIYIDTTSSSDHTFKLVRTLQDRGYKMDVWSYIAPLDVALGRVLEKQRGGDLAESITKRAGAFSTLPKLVHGFDDGKTVTNSADTVRFFINGQNGIGASQSVMWQRGQLRVVDEEFLPLLPSYLHLPSSSDIRMAFGRTIIGHDASLDSFAQIVQAQPANWAGLETGSMDFRDFVKLGVLPPDRTLRRYPA